VGGINQVIIVGRLTRDPELKQINDSTTVCNFSVATSEKWTDKTSGEVKEKAEFHNIATFGKLAEICGRFLTKGKQVYVSGKIETRTYDKDGETRYITGIKADKVEFLGSAASKEETAETAPSPGPAEKFMPPPQTAGAKKAVKNFAPGAINSDEGF